MCPLPLSILDPPCNFRFSKTFLPSQIDGALFAMSRSGRGYAICFSEDLSPSGCHHLGFFRKKSPLSLAGFRGFRTTVKYRFIFV
jgi:hypothetical protein